MSESWNFTYSRTYRGPVQAVLLDWAGTTVDFGCLAPTLTFVEVFARKGIAISSEEARAPMGAHKKLHIQQIIEMPSVRERWQQKYGRPPAERDIEELFAEFVPLQLACLARYATLIPGTLEVVAYLRARGIRIGSTSGYTREMMEINLAEARRQGYVPDSMVCASDVPAARPYPFMCFLNLIQLQVACVQACVKVDDTVPGIEEGLNAGMWTVGVAVSGSEVGLSLAEWQALSASDQAARRAAAYRRLLQAGAHYVIDTIADLPRCIEDIEARLRRGEKP